MNSLSPLGLRYRNLWQTEFDSVSHSENEQKESNSLECDLISLDSFSDLSLEQKSLTSSRVTTLGELVERFKANSFQRQTGVTFRDVSLIASIEKGDALAPIKLLELEEIHKRHSEFERLGCNWAKSLGAGFGSMAGQSLTGLVPEGYTDLEWLGAWIGGAANGGSTIFTWITPLQRLIGERLLKDIPKLVAKINELEAVLELLKQQECVLQVDGEALLSDEERGVLENDISTQPLISESNILEQEEDILLTKDEIRFLKKAHLIPEKDEEAWMCINTRKKRNFFKLLLAGTPSGIGGCGSLVLSDEVAASIASIVLLAGFSGLGNFLSTYLAYERECDQIISYRALKSLPKIVGIVEKLQGKLLEKMARADELRGDLILKPLEERKVEDWMSVEEKVSKYWCMRSLFLRNCTYVNFATWPSFFGGALSLIFPGHSAATFFGGSFSAGANIASTALPGEKKDDEAIFKMGVRQYPLLVKKIVWLGDEIKRLKFIETRI